MLIYAGIGSRETPPLICSEMTSIASQLCESGWLLRSGHAKGADQAFEAGATRKEVHLPWEGYNYGRTSNPNFHISKPTLPIITIAAQHHPNWDMLSDEAKLFMVRNTTIVLGLDLLTPVNMIICWTPRAQLKGGTAHAMRVAMDYNIPVFNLARNEDKAQLCEFVHERERNKVSA